MLRISIFICIIQFLSNYPSVYCNEDDDSSCFKKDVDDETDSGLTAVCVGKSIDENDLGEVKSFIDPHSLFYDRSSKKVIDDTEPLLIKQGKGSLVLKKTSEDCNTLKVYYKRLILMLLSTANLKAKDDFIEGQLFIKATYDQIETVKQLETENYSVKEIDLILSEIISNTQYYNYFFHIPNISEVVSPLFNLLNHYVEIIVITTTILAIAMLSRIMSLLHALVIILIVLLTISFYMTWWHLMKEAEIKLAVVQVKYTEMPAACQPHKMSVWDKLKSYLLDNKECEKYVEARMSNPKLGVTPVVVLSHMLATIILQPFALIGETISKFIVNATAHLNWLSGPVQTMLYMFLPAFFIILVFALRGGSINMGLGPLFRFSFATRGQISVPDNDKRKTIELIREVLAENAKVSATNSIQGNISADNVSKDQVTKLITNESKREQICASGDSVQNDLILEESKTTNEECIEIVKADTAKHNGSGDA